MKKGRDFYLQKFDGNLLDRLKAYAKKDERTLIATTTRILRAFLDEVEKK